MEISVKMDAQEFQEYMEFREARSNYEFKLQQVRKAPERISCSLANAVKPVDGKPGRWKIVDQEHMNDAMGMAAEFLE